MYGGKKESKQIWRKKDYYKPKNEFNIYNKNSIEYKSNRDRNNILPLKEYLYKRDIIIDVEEFDTWNIQLTIAINFIFSKNAEKEYVMHSKGDNIKFTSYNDANKVVDELFDSLISIYQGNLETSMGKSEFIFDSVEFMYYKCHKVNFRRGGLYIDSPGWIKKKQIQKINMINVFNMW